MSRSANSSSVSSASDSTDNVDDLRAQIYLNLARSLASATDRLARAAEGQSVFTDDADASRTLALLKYLRYFIFV
jgi:hypothetical protein